MSEQRVVAVDLGGTHIRAAVVSASGALTHLQVIETQASRGPASVIERMADLIARTAIASGLPADAPVGVASPGPLNPRTGTVLYTPNLPGWLGIPLVEQLRGRTAREVFLANDGNCGALGEVRFGSAKGVDDLIYLALGTGVGGGVISGGTLIDGTRGLGAEVGHVVIALDGPRCSCGSVGCLEAFVSGWAIQREAEAVATTFEGTTMRALAGNGPIHAGVVGQAAGQGDPAAMLILDRAGRALGAAMGAFTNLFNPRMIVIGGGVAALAEHLLGPARRVMPMYCFVDMRDDLAITYSSLGMETGVFGAAALAFSSVGA